MNFRECNGFYYSGYCCNSWLIGTYCCFTTYFFLLKIIGAFYLLWFAFQTLRRHSTSFFQETSLKHKSLKRNYFTAVGINLLNPKAILFNMVSLPQFVHANDPMATPKLLILGLFYIPISLPINILIVFMANKLFKGLKQNSSYLCFFDWLIAGVFTIFALRILITLRFT